MKDIPVYSTDNGVASLGLKGAKPWQNAYIKILSASDGVAFLQECVDFCKTCGAESIYASGDEGLDKYPCSATLVQMQRPKDGMEEGTAAVFPVTEKTVGQWRDIYNQRMAGVPNAAYMTWGDEKKYLTEGDCYFVHRDGVLLGIGKASGNTVDALISVVPGAGCDVLKAMTSVLSEDTVKVLVALENSRAVALYERMGFVQVAQVSKWYKIL